VSTSELFTISWFFKGSLRFFRRFHLYFGNLRYLANLCYFSKIKKKSVNCDFIAHKLIFARKAQLGISFSYRLLESTTFMFGMCWEMSECHIKFDEFCFFREHIFQKCNKNQCQQLKPPKTKDSTAIARPKFWCVFFCDSVDSGSKYL
jgi:hypothetical protein